MAKANSTQSVAVTRSSLSGIAGTLEGTSCHLEAMLKVSFEQLVNIDSNVSTDGAMEIAGNVMSLLDAARNYLDEVKKANRLLYEQAWKLPVQSYQEA